MPEMDYKTLDAEIRSELKKSAARKYRKAGKIPAVIYGHKDPISITLDGKDFEKKFKKIAENTILTINVGKNSHSVLMKSYQDDIISNTIQHIDFYEIEKGKLLKTNVPVHVEGSAKGVREGGILEQRLHEVEVECLPKDIPEIITVDVTELEAGDAIHVEDLPELEGVKILNIPEQTIVSVTIVKEVVEETAEEDEDIEDEAAEGEESEGESEAEEE